MPTTNRLYEKSNSAVAAAPTPSITPTVSPTISVTPSVTPQFSVTPSISVTPSVTATISVTPSPSSSPSYIYLANKYSCIAINGEPSCGQFLGQDYIYNGSGNFIAGYFYRSGSIAYQPITSVAYSGSTTTVSSSIGYTTCLVACGSGSIALTPTPTISITPSNTATISVTPSVSITPSTSISATPSITPSLSISNTPSVTPSITPSPSSGSL